jgi:U3 small nucleolar RNA-associated protein 15
VVAGMVDGLVSVSRREEETRPTKQERKKVSYRYAPDGFQTTSVDLIIPEEKNEVIAKHDTCLRKFQYSKAVDCVIMPYVTNKKPAVTVGVFQELIRWGLVLIPVVLENTYTLRIPVLPNAAIICCRR